MTSRWSPAVVVVDCNKTEEQLPFHKCLLDMLVPDNDTLNDVEVTVSYENGKLILAPGKGATLFHPPMCPLRKLSDIQKNNLDPGTISGGAAVIVRSSDGFVLLTRRSKNMTTFPGLWFEEAAVRELQEETGVTLNEDEQLRMLCLFESCYPIFGSGLPKRRHVVFYYVVQCKRDKVELTDKIRLDERELDAYMWLSDESLASIIDCGNQSLAGLGFWEVSKGRLENIVDLNERLSTGTQYSLSVAHKMFTK